MFMHNLMRLALAIMLVLLCVTPALAKGKADQYPWAKYSLNAGGFLTAVDTKVSLGTSGVGVGIDLEEVTGMQSSNTGYRLGARGRFGDSMKHSVEVSYFYFNRDSSRTLLIDSGLGTAGDAIQSKFNIQMYKLNYNYSLLMDDRVNFSVGLGLYVMPISYTLENVTTATRLETADITAPLPTLNMGFEFALTPKLILRQGVELFYLEYGGFTGSLVDVNIGADYRISKHFGLGLGVDAFDLKLEANGKDYPEIDFNGDIKFSYVGLMLYGKYFF